MSGLEIIERRAGATEPSSPIEVTVRHSGIESRIIGNPESVLRELISYFSKTYPSIELVSKLILSVDSAEFLQSYRNLSNLARRPSRLEEPGGAQGQGTLDASSRRVPPSTPVRQERGRHSIPGRDYQ